jgi:hypothetical protein
VSEICPTGYQTVEVETNRQSQNDGKHPVMERNTPEERKLQLRGFDSLKARMLLLYGERLSHQIRQLGMLRHGIGLVTLL